MNLDPHTVTFGGFKINMDWWTIAKDLLTICVGGAAAIIAALGYKLNAQNRRAEFICKLHQSFFEDETYKSLRRELDSGDDDQIRKIVDSQSENFIDFLNFFQLVAYLRRHENLTDEKVKALLGYYLRLLRDKPAIREYIRNPRYGFEELNELLVRMEVK